MINKELIISKIEELEGMPEGVPFFKNNNVYFDHLNLSWLSNDILREYGVTFSLAAKFNFLYGHIGNEAKTALKKTIKLTDDEIKALFNVSVQVSIQEVYEHVGIKKFNDLPDSAQIILVSLWRQFGRLTKSDSPALTMASSMLLRGNIKLAIRYLKDEKGWSDKSKEFVFKRMKEAEMLECFVKEGK
jgi:hypothetical protein